jgi:hypothetical protein
MALNATTFEGKEPMTTMHDPAEHADPAQGDDQAAGTLPRDADKEAAEVESLIRTILSELLANTQQPQLPFNGKLAVDEKEAADLLGLNPWQLRDLRTSGKISHHRIVGGRVRYTPDDLKAYLDSGHHRVTG